MSLVSLTQPDSAAADLAADLARIAMLCGAQSVALLPCDTAQAMIVPLNAQGSALGALAVCFAAPTSEQQHALLHALADGLAMRLHSTRLQARIERLTSQLTLINQLGHYTTSIHDRQQLFTQITRVIYELLGYDHIQLLLIRGAMVELVHASGEAGEALLRQGFAEPIGGRGIIGWVAESGQVWASDDVRDDPHFIRHTLLPHTAAEVALPLRVGDRIIGVLDVQSDQPHGFATDDIFLLQTIADQIAPALEYHRLFVAERRERELAMTLSDISRIISSSLELDQVLDRILREIGRVVPHNGTRITLREPDELLRVVAARGYLDNTKAMDSLFRIEDAPLSAPVLFEHRTLVIADARVEPRWYWQMGAEQVRSWCAAPLVIKDDCIGWLCVDWHAPGFYTDEHGKIMRAFADQVVVAIENARLYAAVKELSERLEQKVERRTAQLQHARDENAAKAAQLSALVQRVVRVQEDERQRIAHDLHDGVTQSILAAIYELHAVRRRLASGAHDVDARLDESQQLLDSTLVEMKRIIYALRPRALDELGLLAALEHLASTLRAHHRIAVAFATSGTSYQLVDAAELAIYRIVQEATHNSIRHAAATGVQIAVAFHTQCCCIIIEDDGCGFDTTAAGGGLGLVGMHERAQALGGHLSIRSVLGVGTTVTLKLPRATQDDKMTG